MLEETIGDGCEDLSEQEGAEMMDILEETDGVREDGTVRISNEVLAIIAGIATMEIDGVARMAGSLMENISERLGREDLGRGIKVETKQDSVAVDVYISVRYGCRIPKVARRVQGNVKRAIQNMTNLDVSTVNVHVQEVQFPSHIDDEEDDEGE